MKTVRKQPKAVLPYFENSHGTGFEEHAFFEAASIRKIKGSYYLVYSSEQMHELCYATSKYPDRGFSYGGVIISSGDIGYHGRKSEDSLAYTSTNHGGLVEISGQWYIFYHRITQASMFSRQGCAEPVSISEDGLVAQVEMTSCGLNSGPLPAKGMFSAHIACNLLGPNGAFKITREDRKATEPFIYEEELGSKEEERNQYIANITNGTGIGIKYFAFGDTNKIIFQLRGKLEGNIRIHIDEFGGKLMGERKISVDTDHWTELEVLISRINGIHGVFFVFTGDGYLELNGFTFE